MRDRFLWWGSVPLAIGEEIKLTPGQAAYVKWRETVFAQVTGNTELMDQVRHQLVVRIAPEWVDCIPTVTAAWEGIAQAAIDAIPPMDDEDLNAWSARRQSWIGNDPKS